MIRRAFLSICALALLSPLVRSKPIGSPYGLNEIFKLVHGRWVRCRMREVAVGDIIALNAITWEVTTKPTLQDCGDYLDWGCQGNMCGTIDEETWARMAPEWQPDLAPWAMGLRGW